MIGAFDDYKTVFSVNSKPTDHIPIFTGKEALTMFADYRVPQILRHLGIFEYSQQLEHAIDTEQVMDYSSLFEVELRAATVIAVDRIMHEIRTTGSENLKSHVQRSYEVDWLLW